MPTPQLTSPAGGLDTRVTRVTAFFDAFAPEEQRWRRRNRTYHLLIERIYRSPVPPGRAVLEIGSGSGDLLAALEPDRGVGIDVSTAMVELARARHPELELHVAAGETWESDEQFDYIVLSDVVPFASDLLALFKEPAWNEPRAHEDRAPFGQSAVASGHPAR